MRKKRCIVILLVLIVGLPLLAIVGYRLFRGPVADTGNPRRDAEEAPIFPRSQSGSSSTNPLAENPSGGQSETGEPPTGSPRIEEPVLEPVSDWERYGWPDDFKLPLEITFDDTPEVPEGVGNPSKPAEKEE